MNKYLEKIAESFTDKQMGAATIGTIGGVGAMGVAGHHATKPLIKQMRSKGPMTKQELRRVLRHNKDVNVTFSAHKAFGDKATAEHFKNMMSRHGPFYAGDEIRQRMHSFGVGGGKMYHKPMKKGFVNMKDFGGKKSVKDLTVALHEMGHAKDFHSGGNKYISALKRTGHGASTLAHQSGLGILAGGVMSLNDKTKDYAWAAPVVAAAPLLRSEAAANYHGYQMSKNHISKASRNHFLRTAGKNMLGYGAPVAAGAGVIYAANKLMHRKDDKKK